MERSTRIENLLEVIPNLSDDRLELIDNIINVLKLPINIFVNKVKSDLITDKMAGDFGDILKLHHFFSKEPFSKDKFEFALEKVLKMSDIEAELAPRNNPGYDIRIRDDRVSLKTEASAKIGKSVLSISKFMELGTGDWGGDPDDLIGLRDQFLSTLSTFNRLFTLRALEKTEPNYKYELVEIPLSLLKMAEHGKLEMKSDSTQLPKPGYCHVYDGKEEILRNRKFCLYFDAGTERKLQMKSIKKVFCVVHASWSFKVEST